MLHCLPAPDNFAANPRPSRIMKWQQQPSADPLFPGKSIAFSDSSQFDDLNSLLGEMPNRNMKTEYNSDNGLPGFGDFPVAGTGILGNGLGFGLLDIAGDSLEMDHSLSRTSSCPPPEQRAAATSEFVFKQKTESPCLKKRKAEVASSDHCKDEKIKADIEEEESKMTEKRGEMSPSASKPDYIHVRARRGQATDSHSLAERARREKISKKMKCLQDLVPGCNKITGKAGMLDEIINYVQSLQRQVEFLSLKLAALNPTIGFNLDTFLGREFPGCVTSLTTAAAASSETANLAYPQFNQVQHGITSCGLDMSIDPPQSGLEIATRCSSVPADLFTNSTSFSRVETLPTWESHLQSLYTGEFH